MPGRNWILHALNVEGRGPSELCFKDYEGVRAAIVAGGAAEWLRRCEASLEGCRGMDSPAVFELAEHVLHAMAVQRVLVRDRYLGFGLGRDARLDATIVQGLSQPVGLVTPVSEQDLGLRQRIEHQRRPCSRSSGLR